MDTDLRSSLVAAGAAFALSSLVGLISGVGFGALLGRALVGALLFGALAFGAMRLIRAFNLDAGLHPAAERAPEADGGPEAHSVDIVLDEEGPAGFEDAAPAEGAEPRQAPADRFAEAENPEIAHAAASVRRGSRPIVESLEADSIGGEDVGSLLDEDDVEEAREVPSPAFAASAAHTDGFDELDVLPDLEGFSDSFAAPEYKSSDGPRTESQAAPGGRPPVSGGGDATAMGGRAGLDPASLAQAVRTILKRDQKG